MSRAPPASTRTHSTSSTASATSTASSVTAVDAKSIAEMDKQPENAKSVDGGRDNEAVSRGPEVDPPAHVAAGAPPPPPSSSSTSSHLTSDINTLSLPPSRDTGSPASTPAPCLSTTTAATDTDTVKGSAEPGSSPDPEAQREPDIYDRFSPSRKKLIVCIVSYAAFLGREFDSGRVVRDGRFCHCWRTVCGGLMSHVSITHATLVRLTSLLTMWIPADMQLLPRLHSSPPSRSWRSRWAPRRP